MRFGDDHRLVELKTKADAFLPSIDFTRSSDEGAGVVLVPRARLEQWTRHGGNDQ